jgi:hypothetical protein
MACGACGAACRSNSIGIPAEYSDEEVVENIWNWLNPEGALS